MRRLRLHLAVLALACVACGSLDASLVSSAPDDAARRLRESLFANHEALGFSLDEGQREDASSWHADPVPLPSSATWLTDCQSISKNATGNLSDTNTTGCILPANETIVVPSGSRIAGDGSLVFSEGTVLTCSPETNEFCVLTVALGAGLFLYTNARLTGAFLNITSKIIEIGNNAHIDADGKGDPDEKRGWTGVGGAGYGGDGASCPSTGQTLPTTPGGPGYAFQEFIDGVINANTAHALGKPPPQGTGAGGAGGGAVVVVCETLRFLDVGSISADGVAPPRGSKNQGGGSGGSVVVFATEVAGGVDDAGDQLPIRTGGEISRGVVRAGGGRGGEEGSGGGGGGGGRVAVLAPAVWPPSVTIGVGGGRSGGACGNAGFHGAAGTTLNAKTRALSVSNADPLLGRVAPAPAACLTDGAWGQCAVTRLAGALPLRGIVSLRITDAAVACTDVCGASSQVELSQVKSSQITSWFTTRGLLGGDGGGGGGSGDAIVHLEVSESITLTGNAHLLHGGSASRRRTDTRSGTEQTATGGTLWVVSPLISVADRSTIRVIGSVSFDGGPQGSGSFAVQGQSVVRVVPAPPDAGSYVFNVADVRVEQGGTVVVDGSGALTITGRGEDIGALIVGDENPDAFSDTILSHMVSSTANPNSAEDGGLSSIAAGRLVVDRFSQVRVSRRGAIRATQGIQSLDDDVQCSAKVCPAYVYGSGDNSNSNSIVIPCQTSTASPFALQLCHGKSVDVIDGGVVAASAVHVYNIAVVSILGGAVHADAGGCRAGEGQGRGESFVAGAGAGGGYGGAGGDGFTPAQVVKRTETLQAMAGANGTVARGGSAYGDLQQPCSPASSFAGGLGSGGGAGAGAGYGGAGGGLVVIGAAMKPATALIVSTNGRLSANGGDGGGTDSGFGGGGSGGSVLVFSRQFLVNEHGRVSADGGKGARSGGEGGGGGGGGGRVHLEWASHLNSDDGIISNRTAPDGVVTAGGGVGGDESQTSQNSESAIDIASSADGTVTASACAPGFAGLLCSPCVAGTYSEGWRNLVCEACASIPIRAVFIDPPNPNGAGATQKACPYQCNGKSTLVFPACVTRLESAVASVGGPACAGALITLIVMLIALPISTLVSNAKAAELRAVERERRAVFGGSPGGSGRGVRLGSSSFAALTGSTSRKRSGRFTDRFTGSITGSMTSPFLEDEDQGEFGEAGEHDAGYDNEKVSQAFLARVYFSGANTFGDPWRLPPTPPPNVQHLLNAEEWQRLVRACAMGAPTSWGVGRRYVSESPTGTPSDRETERRKEKPFIGASRARWRRYVDLICGLLFPPLQNWWRKHERHRVARCLTRLLYVYDRRCLRSARARALQEGLQFGSSTDATSAWLDFFAQGDEESISVPEEHVGPTPPTLPTPVHLPLAIVFGGCGTFQLPWRWETGMKSDESLPAAALRGIVPAPIISKVARNLRGVLRRCRKLATLSLADKSSTGLRLKVERRRGRGGGGGTAFAFDTGTGSENTSNVTTEKSNVFQRVAGLHELYSLIKSSINPELGVYGVELVLCAFDTPAEDPFGGFQLGVVACARDGNSRGVENFQNRASSAPRAFHSRKKSVDESPFGVNLLPMSTPPNFDLSLDTHEIAAADRAANEIFSDSNESDVECGDRESGGDSLVGSFVENMSLRGAAAWAMAAATSESPSRANGKNGVSTGGDDHFQSLRNLTSPRHEGTPRLTPVRKSRTPRTIAGAPESSRRDRTPLLSLRGDGSTIPDRSQTPNVDTTREVSIATCTLLVSAPVGMVVYVPSASALGSSTSKKSWSRFVSDSLIFPKPSTRGSVFRVLTAIACAMFVTADAVTSFALLAQTMACDAAGARLGLVLSFSLALPFSPVAGATACFASLGMGGSTFRETANALRAYAVWTLDSLICCLVAFTASALARAGVNALGRCEDRGGHFGGALSADGAAWFAPPVVAGVAKILAAAISAKRAADLDEKQEEADAR